MKFINTIACVILSISITVAQFDISWEVSLGGSAADAISDIQILSDGDYLMCGLTYSEETFAGAPRGGADAWVIKTSNDGSVIWQKRFGGTGYDTAWSCIESTDGYVIAGHTKSNDGDVQINQGSHDIWIIKLDKEGNIIWQKTFGGTSHEWNPQIINTQDGGLAIIASSYSTTDFWNNYGEGFSDMVFILLDSEGTLTLTENYGGSRTDYGISILQTEDGGFLIGANTSSSDFDVEFSHSGLDYWLLKLSPFGNIEWEKTYGGQGSNNLISVQILDDGNYLIAGMHGGLDCWLIWTDDKGEFINQKSIGGSGIDQPFEVLEDDNGHLFIFGVTLSLDGIFTDIGDDRGDLWVTKLNRNGEHIHTQTFGGSLNDGARAVQEVPDGFIIAGVSESSDGDVSFNHGELDAWISKLLVTEINSTSDNIENLSINTYPNPVMDRIYLDTDNHFSSYTIYNAKGSQILEGKLEASSIDVSHLQTGVFFLQLIDSDSKSVKRKFVKF